MTDASTLGRDPEWLPHRIDPAARTLQFLHIPRSELSAPQFLSVAAGPVFATHAKRGGDFSATEAKDSRRAQSPLVEEEIAQVGQWVELIARQAGLPVPVTGRAPLL